MSLESSVELLVWYVNFACVRACTCALYRGVSSDAVFLGELHLYQRPKAVCDP